MSDIINWDDIWLKKGNDNIIPSRNKGFDFTRISINVSPQPSPRSFLVVNGIKQHLADFLLEIGIAKGRFSTLGPKFSMRRNFLILFEGDAFRIQDVAQRGLGNKEFRIECFLDLAVGGSYDSIKFKGARG